MRVTSKGQVTIPIEIRRLLGLRDMDSVAFLVSGRGVSIARRGRVVEETAGALCTNLPRLTIQEEREAAEQTIADEVVERSI